LARPIIVRFKSTALNIMQKIQFNLIQFNQNSQFTIKNMSFSLSPAATITGDGNISAFINGKQYSIANDHANYKALIQAIREKKWEEFVKLSTIAQQLKEFVEVAENKIDKDSNFKKLEINDGIVYYYGEILQNELTDRIVQFMKEDLPFEPLLRFLEKLLDNPSKRALDELIKFLDILGKTQLQKMVTFWHSKM